MVSILARLRGRAAARPTARRTLTAGDQSRLGADRSWLIGCCQARAGLRAEEVARVTITALAKALGEEGIRLGPGPSSSNADWLAGLASDPAARERIVDALDDLVDGDRRELGVEVTCKGRKRKAPFPIDLVIDLLTIGLWAVRDGQVRNWASRRLAYIPPETVFLSFKTGNALTPGAVGDLVKDAFVAAGILGSGHRLRAYFGNALAQRLILDRLEMNGFVYDASVERWVLEKVADSMGHAKTSTTVRHYVDQAAMRITGKSAQEMSVGMTGVQRALTARKQLLCGNDYKEIEALIERLSSERRQT